MEEELLRRGARCDFADLLALRSPGTSRRVSACYCNMVTRAPWAFHALYRAGDAVRNLHRLGLQSPVYLANRHYAGDLQTLLEEEEYDCVIMPHLFPAEAVTALRRQGGLRTKTVAIATDYACIPFWEETCPDLFVIPHRDLMEDFLRRGIPEEKLAPLGIPVSRAYTQEVDKREARAKLGLPLDGPLYLVVMGSMGAGKTGELLRPLMETIGEEGCVLAVCGTNEEKRKSLQREFADCSNLRVIGYTNQLPLYMAASDLLVTKPGGLTSTEAAARGIPLLLADPIPGCETYNARFFAQRGMARLCATPEELARDARELMESSSAREDMIRAQRRFVSPLAAGRICDILETPRGAEGRALNLCPALGKG